MPEEQPDCENSNPPIHLSELFDKIRDNPVATAESKEKRVAFEQTAREILPYLNDFFPAYSFAFGLAGSVQVGYADGNSDIDYLLYLERKDHQAMDQNDWAEVNVLFDGISIPLYDIQKIVDQLRYTDEQAGENLHAYWASVRQMTEFEFLLIDPDERYPTLCPITQLFAPSINETMPPLTEWRKAILEAILKRPDAKIFWENVFQPAWRYFNVFPENSQTLKAGDRSRRIKDAFKEYLRKKGDLDPTDLEMPEHFYEVIERARGQTYLPDLQDICTELGVRI